MENVGEEWGTNVGVATPTDIAYAPLVAAQQQSAFDAFLGVVKAVAQQSIDLWYQGQTAGLGPALFVPLADVSPQLGLPTPIALSPLELFGPGTTADVVQWLPSPLDITKALIPPDESTGNGGGGEDLKKNLFLPLLLGGMALVAAAPTVYRVATSKAKGKQAAVADKVAKSLDDSSERATSLIRTFLPIIALPATYIAIDELENRKIISGGLGDATQTLIATMAAGDIVSGLSGIVKAVL